LDDKLKTFDNSESGMKDKITELNKHISELIRANELNISKLHEDYKVKLNALHSENESSLQQLEHKHSEQ